MGKLRNTTGVVKELQNQTWNNVQEEAWIFFHFNLNFHFNSPMLWNIYTLKRFVMNVYFIPLSVHVWFLSIVSINKVEIVLSMSLCSKKVRFVLNIVSILYYKVWTDTSIDCQKFIIYKLLLILLMILQNIKDCDYTRMLFLCNLK
jgi:hypothetical protein